MSQELPLVTVGVPCYNRAEGLRQTLDSIISQTYINLEIIVSDNHSPDPSVRKVGEALALKDKRVRYYRQQKNIGALPNFLYLASECKGDFFMWAADDDWWAPEFIEEMVRLLEEDREAAVGFCRTIPVEDDFSRHKLYPDFYPAMCEFKDRELGRRITAYIQQKDAFGKAHLIYGLHRSGVLRDSLNDTTKHISKYIEVSQLAQFDMLFNAAILVRGPLALSDKLMRRFGSGPRNTPRREPKTFWERFLRLDGRSLIYYDCFLNLIETLSDCESMKQKLLRTIRRRKAIFILERIGRRLFIYKVYWHFFKRMKYKTLGELVGSE